MAGRILNLKGRAWTLNRLGAATNVFALCIAAVGPGWLHAAVGFEESPGSQKYTCRPASIFLNVGPARACRSSEEDECASLRYVPEATCCSQFLCYGTFPPSRPSIAIA
jgi:hypothetical protein